MNYTINEIPDEATDANGADFAVMWQNNKTKKISILNLLKTLVKKSEVTNTVSATSNNVITSKGVSSLLTIPASNTTITNAPPLQNNATYRFFFTEQITGSDDTTAMAISYNGTSYSVKATANGSLKNFTAYPIATEQTRNLAKGEKSEEEKGETKAETKGETKSGTRATVTTYVYCQAYTTLEMMFDGTQFIIMGNPVVISNSDYTVYTDGSMTYTANVTPLKGSTAWSRRYNLGVNQETDWMSTPSTSPFLILIQNWNERAIYMASEWGNEWRYSLVFGNNNLVSFLYSNYSFKIVNNHSDMVSIEIIRGDY